MAIKQKSRAVQWLFVGFLLTGIGTALLGCVLPTLISAWHLNDDQAGTLLAAQFSGSALGALLLGRSFYSSLARGYLLLIASAIAIAYVPFVPETLRFLSFGLGLGWTMTSTSMVIGSLYTESRGRALSLLNGFWTLGAALSPGIASVGVHRWPPSYLFLGLAAALAIVFAFVGRSGKTLAVSVASHQDAADGTRDVQWIVIFAALGGLYVGVEASIGGWLMSYVHRLPDASSAWAPIATSSFWVALLLGRLLAPAVLLRISESQLLSASIVIAWMSTALMLLGHSPLAIVLAVASAGLALGPIFPLCLAKALAAMKDSSKAKWVFSISGSGGAILPWMTGALSAHENSLRIGLLIPLIALTGMMLLDRLEPAAAPA